MLDAGHELLPKTTPKRTKKKIVPSGEEQSTPLDKTFFEAGELVTPQPDSDDLEF